MRLNQTPLHGLHVALGAKMIPFAGYSMPVSYPPGVMQEHRHCRAMAGFFDVSHMGCIGVTGPDAVAFLERMTPADVAGLGFGQGGGDDRARTENGGLKGTGNGAENGTQNGTGQCRYSFLLNGDAGFRDDLIINRTGADAFTVVVNGACKAADFAHMQQVAGDCDFDVALNLPDAGLIALQGPAGESVLTGLGFDVAGLKFMESKQIDGYRFTRCGYTGEDGFEIQLPPDRAQDFARRLLDDARVAPVGLGARDSLRLEAGLPLYGQDLTPRISPVEAGLMWAIPKRRRRDAGFIGARALQRIMTTDAEAPVLSGTAPSDTGPPDAVLPHWRRIGFRPEGRAPVRAGAALFLESGEPAGIVTSGGFAPGLNAPVAHAYAEKGLLPAEPDGGDLSGTPVRLFAEVRGKRLPGRLHKMPFVPLRYKR